MTDSEYLYFSDCYSAMLFSKQFHWILIIFNSINWVKSQTRRMQTSETSNIHARVESCLFIVSSRPTCWIAPLPVFKSQPLGRLDTMNMHASTQAWTFEISNACIHRFRNFTQSILLKMIVWGNKFSAIACWKACTNISWQYLSPIVKKSFWPLYERSERCMSTQCPQNWSWLINTLLSRLSWFICKNCFREPRIVLKVKIISKI